MKEKIKKNGDLAIALGCIGVPVLALLVGNRIGYKRGHSDGFQDGCNMLFKAMVREFPGLNYSDFVAKYSK